jgi:WD40 repeat protein
MIGTALSSGTEQTMKTFLISLILLVTLAVPTLAQDEAPLVFFGRGLFTMDAQTHQVLPWDECGNFGRPRLSPTGDWLAVGRAEGGLRLCNMNTHEVLDIDPPQGLSGELSLNTFSWSPDRAEVAWAIASSDDDHWLAAYNLEAEEARIVTDELPISRYPLQVMWGQSGILVSAVGLDALLYSPEGELLAENLVGNTDFVILFWATDEDGKEYLGRYQNYWMGDVIDPLTGDVFFPSGIELYSPLAPDGLTVSMSFETNDWMVNLPDGETVTINDLSPALGDFLPFLQFDPENIGISPDGESFAIFDLDQLIWSDGEVDEIPGSIPAADGTGVIWGPMAYRIVGELLSPLG